MNITRFKKEQQLINWKNNLEVHVQILQNSGYFLYLINRPPINIAIPGGYTEEILKAVESMKTAEIVIQKEVPASEEDEMKLQE